MQRTLTIVSFVLFASFVTSTWAVNLSFIPGDAFYSTRLTANVVDNLPADGGQLKFDYAYPKGSGDFCGYAGFARLEVVDAKREFVEGVRTVHHKIRSHYPQRLEIRIDDDGSRAEFELNGLQAFVCNRNVSWKKQRLGIKYNESWFSLPKAALAGPRNGNGPSMTACMQYVSFVPGAEPVAHDWKNAARFAGLEVTLPDVEGWGVAGPEIFEPVVAQADDIQLIVLEDNSIKDAYNQRDQIVFYAISSEGVQYCYWDDDHEEGESRFFEYDWQQD